MICFLGLGILLLAIALPALIWASDWEGDNLPDSWKAHYGLSTNVYDPADLVGWWQMEPNTNYLVLDRWTNQINGSLINFPTNPYVTGIFSNALAFPTNAQVNFGTNAALNNTTNQFTFSAWFQTTTNVTQPATIAAWADAQTNSWSVGADTNGAAYITFSNSSGAVQTVEPATNAIPIYDGSWHQVAATYDTNQVATVYVDGESQASGTITNWSGGPEASFIFGVTNTNSVNPAFTLDETRLYSRALGPDEVIQLPFTYSDLNGSGLTVYDDYLEGLNPLSTNNVVTSGFINSGLTGYYGSTLPTLTKSSGDAQTVCASTFEANPLVVQVTDGSGTPLTNAPITFALASGSNGGLSQTSGGTTTASISLTTDSDGNATIYYEAGADTLRDNIIQATAVANAGNVSVAFTAYCGIQNGLALWLKAGEGVTQDGSGNVSLWADQGVNHNDVSQTTTGEYPVFAANQVNGKPVFTFNGSQYLAANDASTLDPSNITMIVVGQYSASSNDYGSFISKTTSSAQVDGYGMGLLAGPVGGWVDNYSSGAAQGTVVSGQYGTMSFTYDQSNVIFRLNGQTLATEPYTSAINNVSGVPLLIGTTDTAFDYPLTGSIAEVLIYDRVLSSSELQQVEVYLADKYGLYNPDATWISAYSSDVQLEINANEWTKAQADAYVAFLATTPSVPATGLMLWLDAGQGPAVDGNNDVLEWYDRGPFGHVAAQSTEVSPPVLQTDINGNPTVSFNGSQALYCPDYITANNDLTIISVASLANSNNFNMDFTVGGVTNEGGVRAYANYYGSAEFDLYYAGASAGPSANPNEQAINTVTYSRESGAINFYLRGNYNGYGNATATDLSSGFWVGDSVDLDCPWNGTISEVLVYDHVLSGTERDEAESYLADKYTIYHPDATWPLAYPADIQELITENEWSKAETDAYVASLGSAVGAPVLSPPPGHYSSTQTVTVTSDTSDATIYYTTDGTTPTTSSTSVSNGGQITVSSTTQIQLFAADGTLANSPIRSAVYRIGNSGNLVAGDSFTMVNKPDGTVWTWGDDSRGQQGDDQANNPAPVPQQVPDISGVTAVAAAGDHALAITSAGSVWAWGADDVSQGGDGGTTDLLVPTQISGLSNIASVYAGQLNGFAVDNSGNLYAWGDNTNGQLGDGTTNSESAPEAITSVTGVTKIASSPYFTLALKSDGTVWATGNNNNGQLGDGTQNPETYFQQVPGLSNVVDIAVGWGHALALCSDGTMWAWGYGGDGELGQGNYNSSPFPIQVVGLPAVAAVVAVDSKSYAVLGDGTLRSFGGNNEGELGLAQGNTQSQPSPVEPSGVANIMLLAAGTYHTVVCTTTGAFYGWGDNTLFRLTQSFTNTSLNSATEVHDLAYQGFSQVASANGTTVALKNDGTVWVTGSGNGGTLGDGLWNFSERPVQTVGLSNVTSIAAGNSMALAIDSSGNLWAWGGNWDGQLGIGNGNWENAPAQVTVVQNVTAAALGDNHMLAVQSDGTVWASGDDSQGELGDGTTNDENAPIQVLGFDDAVQVAAGTNTSFVLDSEGEVWAWGQNDSGQLGLGTTGNVASPTQITTLPAMVAIAASGNDAMGLDTSGNVWSWGTLGNSDGTPLEQTGVTNVTAIAAGTYHELAIKNDGTLWGLGANFAGQLGNYNYNNASTFTEFTDIEGALAISAGYDTSILAKQDGSVSGFGDCDNGQLAANLGVYNVGPQSLFGIAMSETPPSVSIGTTSTGASAVQFQASASASTGSITEVDYYLNGVKIGTSTTGSGWNYSWTPTTYGDLSFEGVAIDSAGVATVSAPILVTLADSGPPSAPTNLTTTPGPAGTVYLGWTNNGSATTSILIQEENADGFWYTIADLTDPTLTTYTVTGLNTSQNYNFRVAAADDSGSSAATVSYSAGSSNLPVITKVSGDIQTIASSTFAADPMVVQVNDSNGNILSDIPVTFSIATGSDGALALTSGGTSSSSETVTTNADGQATIYYESGSDGFRTNTIMVATSSGTGSATAGFTAYCGIRNGLAAWFRADSGIVSDSGLVSTWHDSTSNEYDVAQSVTGNQPTLTTDAASGKPVVAFGGSQLLTNTSAQVSTNDVTIITVASVVSPAASGTQVVVGSAGSSTAARAYGDDSGNQSFNNGTTTSDGGALAPTTLLNVSSMTYSQSAGVATFYSEGASNGTASLSASALNTGLTLGSLLSASPSVAWNGNIAEVLVYNRVLSTSERQQVEGSLADKYGSYSPYSTWPLAYTAAAQAEITQHQWNKSQADSYVAMQAANPSMLTQGLSLWLKADSGVTVDGSNGGANITSWVDQTGNYTLSQSTAASQPTIVYGDVNGEPGLHFSGTQTLNSPLSLGVGVNQAMTVITVAMTTAPSSQQYSLYLGDGTASHVRGVGYQDSTELFDTSGSSASGAASPASGVFVTEATTLDSTLTNVTFYQNGVQTATGTVSGVQATNAGISVGNSWQGDISEVLVYDHQLSADELNTVNVYLSDKYGFYYPNATWIQLYSPDVQSLITTNQWNESQAAAYVQVLQSAPVSSGLVAWYKVDSGVIQSTTSSAVTEWQDSGFYGYDLSQSTTANQPTYDTYYGVQFSGSQWLSNSAALSGLNDVTIITEASANSSGSTGVQADIGSGSSTAKAFAYDSGNQSFINSWVGSGDATFNDGGSGNSANILGTSTVTYSQSSGMASFYNNGLPNGTATVSADSTTAGITLGSLSTSNSYVGWQGNINEVLIFNRILSPTERQKVEGYLSDKYGTYSPSATWPQQFSPEVQSLIAANQWNENQANAYLSVSPQVSPPPGHYLSSQTITVTAAVLGGTIYYTTNGTTPTTGSTSIASGDQITVSSNTQLKLVTVDGSFTSAVTTATYLIGGSNSLVAGDSFTMVNKPDGTVWTWGDDSRGQQGDDKANNPAAVPQQISSLSGVTAVAAAGDHALAVSGGSVWAWGADDVSQDGDGGTTDLLVPTQLGSLSNIVSVYAGQANGFAVDNEGNLYGWGDNTNGQLGDGTNSSQSTPEAITSVTGVVKIASSPNFTLALKSDGTVWATGSDADGELGDGTQNDENAFQQVPGLTNVVDIAVGSGHALALLSDGTVWSWGYGGDGELGQENSNSSSSPEEIVGLPSAIAVEAVNIQSFIVLADGTVRCFGYNGQGQLGVGAPLQDQMSPVEPSGVSNVINLAAGTSHTVVCTGSGAFYGWGDNTSFKLTQDFNNLSRDTEVHDTAWQGFVAVASAENTTIGLKNDGTVWAVGEGDNGALGQGDSYSTERPIQTVGLSNMTAVAGGEYFAFAIRNDGTLWAWGENGSGQLGIGNYNLENTPTQVANVENVISVAGGAVHMLAVQSNGTVWASGDDSQGELGDGTTNNEEAPIEVSGFNDATEVAAGSNTSFALKSDGTVWAWGQNDSGQLGLGTTGNVASPTQITGLPAMTSISVRSDNAMGIDTSGNVWTWGYLGNSDGTPTEQSGLTDITTVAAGIYHNLAIKSDGTLWGFGAGQLGQLGNGSYNNETSPTQFSDIQGVVGVAGNYASTFLAKQDGSLSGFGSCNLGELAANLGTYVYYPKPLFGIALLETPPTVSITSPTAGASTPMGTSIEFEASTSASAGAVTEVDYYLEGVKIGTATSAGSWTSSWTPTTYGDLTFEAVAYDTAGVAQISAPITVNVPYDSDSNGLPDWWELKYFGQLGNNPSAASPSGDSNTILQDYEAGVVPQSATALISIVSGNSQVNTAGSLLPEALVVSVTDPTGNPLVNMSVTFSVSPGNGLVGTTSTNASSTSVQVMTNSSGTAQAYFQQPLIASFTSAISATAIASASQNSVSFSATTSADNGPPAAASNLTVTSGSPGEANLSWTNNADNATLILVQMQNSDGTWSTIATLSPTQTSYDATGLAGGENAEFQIVSSNANGQATTIQNSPVPIKSTPRYMVLDLGAGMNPDKLTNSGYVLMTNASGNFVRWESGNSVPLNSVSGPTACFASDITEDGTAVGYQVSPNYVLTWNVGSSTPSTNNNPNLQGSNIFIDPSHNMWSQAGYYNGNLLGKARTLHHAGAGDGDPYWNYYTGETVFPYGVNNLGHAVCQEYTYLVGSIINWAQIGGYYNEPINLPNVPIYTLNDPGSSSGAQLPFKPTSLSNQDCIIGKQTNGTYAWWNGSGTYALPAGFVPGSINGATDDDGAPAYQILGYAGSPTSPGALQLLEMDPAVVAADPDTGSFKPPVNVADLIATGSPWTSLGSNFSFLGTSGLRSVINDNGAIVGTATYTPTGTGDPIAAGSHGVMLLPVQVTLQKQGASAPPTNGVLVKKGDTIQMALNPGLLNGTIPLTSYPLQTSQVNWQYRELNGDGTFTSWTNFQGTPEGPEFNYTTTISGIFQVQAIITVNGASETWQYVRQQTDPFGADSGGNPNPIYAKGQPDYFGVADNQWQLDVRNQALTQLGSTKWAAAGSLSPPLYTAGPTFPGLDKCNVFVYQMCNAAGDAPVPLSESPSSIFSWAWDGLPPFSIDWYAPPSGTPSTRTPKAIPGWTSLGTPSSPQPGEVISEVTGDTPTGEITHVHAGILDYDGGWINAGSGNVNRFPNIYPSSSGGAINLYNLPIYPERCSTYTGP